MYSLCTILYSKQRWQTSSTTQLKLRTRTLQALEIRQVKTKQRTFVSFLCWTNFGELYDPLLILIIHYTVHILLYGQDIPFWRIWAAIKAQALAALQAPKQ